MLLTDFFILINSGIKKKLSKQLKQEENHRNGDHMEGQGRGRMEEKVQGIRSIIGCLLYTSDAADDWLVV